MTKSQNESCEGCKHYLGGGFSFCAVNLEDECAAGCFEAWEEEKKKCLFQRREWKR